MPNLNKAVELFDRSMKQYEGIHRLVGNYDNHNKALLNFLYADRGFQYVRSYEELCELAVLLQDKGYKTSNPPCTVVEFFKTVEDVSEECFDGAKPIISESMKLLMAAEKFDEWMKRFEAAHRSAGNYDDNNRALVEFLHAAKGFHYVKNYEGLCELAVLLQDKGYKTSNPPCTALKFFETVEQTSEHKFAGPKPVAPEAIKLQLAAKREQEVKKWHNEVDMMFTENSSDKNLEIMFKGLFNIKNDEQVVSAVKEQAEYHSVSFTNSDNNNDS